MEEHYICSGTCGALISQKQYDEGLTQCGAPQGCTRKGQAFAKCAHCPTCDQHVAAGAHHLCQAQNT